MKILYFGTICDLDAYDKRLEYTTTKPSVASIVFESALLEGFYKNGADIEIHSFPMLPLYPQYRVLHYGGNTEQLPCGYTCRWLKTVNVPVLKQLSRRLDARKLIKQWLKKNAEEGIIFTFAFPPFLVKDILKYAKRFNVKTVAIVPDLLRDMYANENKHSVLYYLKQWYLQPALRVQGDYEGYIYLTEAMREVVAPDKPYMVMEGIADTSNVILPNLAEKTVPRGIMYAGMLHKKYGILNLVEAFEKMDAPDAELWLFGEGTAVPEIKRYAQTNPKIRYFGSVSRSSVLEYERKASLLVNPRDPEEEFTKYSFPSKTIEYMLSGTPLLTTRLKGIPAEYFDYVFSSESNSVEDLAIAMEEAMQLSAEAFLEIGKKAQEYIKKEKNAVEQSKRILTFIEGIYYDAKT